MSRAGQSNYGYANSALDFLCEARATQGLPALSLQWGVIGHVGFVEEAMQVGPPLCSTTRLPDGVQDLGTCLNSPSSPIT